MQKTVKMYVLDDGEGNVLYKDYDRDAVEIDMETRCDYHPLNHWEIKEIEVPLVCTDRETAIKMLQDLQGGIDVEAEHIKADQILNDLLIALGYLDVATEYRRVGKWYS